jgi:hypothetical protein
MPKIVDGKATLDVTLLHSPEEIPDRTDQEVFLNWWKGEAKRRLAPHPRWTGEDRKIAVRLLEKYGYDRLRELALNFWRRHASALTSHTYDRQMILFAAKIPIIEKELQEQAP